MASVTPYLCASSASEALAFYTRAFDATENYRMAGPDGRIGHAELVIAGTILYLSDEWPEMGVLAPENLNGVPVSFVLDVPDADASFTQAVDAGCTVERPLTDEPYGRAGWVRDPFGHRWCVSTSNPDFDPSKM